MYAYLHIYNKCKTDGISNQLGARVVINSVSTFVVLSRWCFLHSELMPENDLPHRCFSFMSLNTVLELPVSSWALDKILTVFFVDVVGGFCAPFCPTLCLWREEFQHLLFHIPGELKYKSKKHDSSVRAICYVLEKL